LSEVTVRGPCDVVVRGRQELNISKALWSPATAILAKLEISVAAFPALNEIFVDKIAPIFDLNDILSNPRLSDFHPIIIPV